MTYVSGNTVLGKHDQTSKLFSLPWQFLGLAAGTFSQCQRFISYLWDRMEYIQNSVAEIQLDHAVMAVRDANNRVRLGLLENELVSTLGMTRMEWINRCPNDPKLRRTGRWLARKIAPDVQLIVAGFLAGRPVLLRVCGKEDVEEEASHAVIGSGGALALQKLAFRTQNPYASAQRTSLAIFEAMRFARRKDRFVGAPTHGILLGPEGKAFQFDMMDSLFKVCSKNTRKVETPNLDAPERWKELETLLKPFPILKARP